MNAFPTLQTDRLILREIVQDDIKHIFEGLSHPDVIRYYGVQYDTLESTQTQMDWFGQLIREQTGVWWAICHLKTHAFMGAAGFNNRDSHQHSAEIGFWLLPDQWGNGYVPEALTAITDYGFNQLGLHCIEAIIETENQNSMTVLEKNGFVHASTDVNCEIKNGRLISLMKFVLTN